MRPGVAAGVAFWSAFVGVFCFECGCCELLWEECLQCGGDGAIDEVDDGELDFGVGDLIVCPMCDGEGGWWLCGCPWDKPSYWRRREEHSRRRANRRRRREAKQ